MPKRIDELLAEYMDEVSKANRKREARKLRDRLIEASSSARRDAMPVINGTNPQKASAILRKSREGFSDESELPRRLRRPELEPWTDRPDGITPFAFDEETVKENRKLEAEWRKENEQIAERNKKKLKADKSRDFNRKLDEGIATKRDSVRARRLADLKRQKGIKAREWKKVVEAAKEVNRGGLIPSDLFDTLGDAKENTGEIGVTKRGPMFWLGLLSTVSSLIGGEGLDYEDIPILNEADPIGVGGKFEEQRRAVEEPVGSIADLRRLARERLNQ